MPREQATKLTEKLFSNISHYFENIPVSNTVNKQTNIESLALKLERISDFLCKNYPTICIEVIMLSFELSIEKLINSLQLYTPEKNAERLRILYFRKIGQGNLPQNCYFDGNNQNYVKYIILTTARSGSTFLVTALNSHPNIIPYPELYNETVDLWQLGYLKENIDKVLKTRDKKPKKFLHNMIFRPYSEQIGAVGFKLMYNNAKKRKSQNLWKELKKDKSIKIIHLIRENYLESLVSLKLALKSNIWSDRQTIISQENPEDSENSVRHQYLIDNLNYDECLDYFNTISDNYNRFKEFFGHHDILEVKYKDMTGKDKNALREIQEFLGLEHKELFSPLVKTENRKMNKVIGNYDELIEIFKNTQWSKFFT